LNMPATSVRDIIIKNDDLVAATHGRGFWILDDITPLRQLDSKATTSEALLFQPQAAIRVRWNMNTDTPLPPDFPAGENPPDGAVLDYYLQSAASGPVTLEIQDGEGKIVRRFSSADPVEPVDPKPNIPGYWIRPPRRLSSAAGMHRFLWDLHYPPVPGIKPEYPIAAVPHDTAPQATSPWALPGKYTVVLSVNGKVYSQPLTEQMDPRVKTTAAGLAQQFKLSKQVYENVLTVAPAVDQIESLRKQLSDIRQRASQADLKAALEAFDKKLQALEGVAARRPGPANEAPSLGGMRARLLMLLGILQEADVAPTTQAASAVNELEQAVRPLMQQWEAVKSQDLAALNAQLRGVNLPELKLD